MEVSNQIGHSHIEAMGRILEFIDGFNVQRLLYAIDTRRFDEETIESITHDIREQNLKLERQKKSLFKYTKSWNREFCHPDNKLIEHSAGLIYRMRSGVSGVKKTLKKFCKPSRRRLPPGAAKPQAIDHSLISPQTAYMATLFGLSHYPPCVSELFVEMIKFYGTMNECLVEAERSLDEEKATKSDWRKCLELLKKACDKCRQHQKIFVQMMDENPMLKSALLNTKTLNPGESNPVLKEWMESSTAEDAKGTFASRRFHNCTLDDISKITFYDTVTESEGDAEVFEGMTIFNCEAEKARQINHVISHFDCLLPEECKKNKIPAIQLYLFKQWCSKGVGYETFLNYFNKRYKKAGGKWDTIGKSALSGATSKHSQSPRKYTIERQFNIQLEQLLEKQRKS